VKKLRFGFDKEIAPSRANRTTLLFVVQVQAQKKNKVQRIAFALTDGVRKILDV